MTSRRAELRARFLEAGLPDLLIFIFPIIFALSCLILLSLHTRVPFLVSSLHDFSQRVLPPLKAGRVPYRDFPFEYPPLFFAVLYLTNSSSAIFSSLSDDRLLAVHVFLTLPVFLTFYLFLVPKKRVYLTVPLLIISVPILIASFDPIAAVLAVVALLLHLRQKDGPALLVLALAAGIKLYPLVFLPVFFLRGGNLRRSLTQGAFFIFCFFLPFFVVVLSGGAKGLAAALLYQGGRGLEYESILAVPYFLAASFGLTKVNLIYRNFAYDISYGWVDNFLGALGFLVFLLFSAALFFRVAGKIRNGEEFPTGGGLFDFVVALVLLLLISSKLLSLQFMIWFLLLVPFVSSQLFKKIYLLSLSIVILSVVETAIAFHWRHFYTGPLLLRNLLLIWLTVAAFGAVSGRLWRWRKKNSFFDKIPLSDYQ